MKNVFVAAIVAVSVMSSVSFAAETAAVHTQEAAPATTDAGKMDSAMTTKTTTEKKMKSGHGKHHSKTTHTEETKAKTE